MTQRIAQPLRALTFQPDAERGNDGGIPVIVSSDAIVDVQDGPEILVHDESAVDLQRAPLPVIATHRGGQVNVGVVEALRIDRSVSPAVMRGLARFGERQEASEYRRDVENGVIRSVSVGYARVKAKQRSDGVLVTTRWMPTHVAMVGEPADVRAGFYRQAPAFEIEAEESASPEPAAVAALPGVPIMADNQAAAGQPAADSARSLPAQPRQDADPSFDYSSIDPAQRAGERRDAIIRLARLSGVQDQKTIEHWVRSGKDWNAIGIDIEKIQQQNSKGVAYLDMPAPELRRYSLWRAMNAVLSNDWRHAGLELEASQEIAKRTQRMHNAKGFFVPLDVQKRDQTAASASGGGYLVATDNLSFIELLRNRMVAIRMGATVMSGLVGNVTIPKQTAGATAYWLANEGTAITEGALTFGQVALSPKTVGAYVEVSRQLMLQSSPSAEQIVMADLASQVARAADLAILHGTGSAGQPTGITATGSIGAVTGTSLAYAGMVEFQTDIASANVDPLRPGYVTTPAVAGLLKARQRFTSTDTPLWQGNIWDGNFEGTPAMSSNQVTAATMIFGDWSQVVVGEWGVLEVNVNEQANFPMGVVGFRAFYTMDVAVRYPAAFSVATSIT